MTRIAVYGTDEPPADLPAAEPQMAYDWTLARPEDARHSCRRSDSFEGADESRAGTSCKETQMNYPGTGTGSTRPAEAAFRAVVDQTGNDGRMFKVYFLAEDRKPHRSQAPLSR